MEAIEAIIASIKGFFEFYMSTDLPHKTLNSLVDVLEYAGVALDILVRDYIAVFFA